MDWRITESHPGNGHIASLNKIGFYYHWAFVGKAVGSAIKISGEKRQSELQG